MRAKVVVLLIALTTTSTVVFVFAPIVYSPNTSYAGPIQNGVGLCAKGCSYPTYESPSCAVFGLGWTYSDYSIIANGRGYMAGPWSYQSGCVAKTLDSLLNTLS